MSNKGSGAELDADFYRLIHQLVGPSLQKERVERRKQNRYRFWTKQWVAPWDGGVIPPDDAFVRVQCYDLTQAGFSFFLPVEPRENRIVAVFGTAPKVIYIGAEVVRCTQVLLHASGLVEHVENRARHASRRSADGTAPTPLVLVGCHFIKRLERNPKESGA